MAGLPTAYITVADADAINTSAEWGALTEAQKEAALSWGRIYLDANYSCVIDETAPSDNVQYANAVFGDYYAQGSLYESQAERGATKTTTREKVKAGSVEVEEEYAVSVSGQTIGADPFEPISNLLMADGCSYTGGYSCGGTSQAVRSR